MTDDDKNPLNIDVFIKLIKEAQDSRNFKNHKTLYLYGFDCSIQQKKRQIPRKRKLASLAN